MSIQEVSAEQLAERFHHYDRALRADHNRASERDTEAWEEIPHQERSRLVAAARLTLLAQSHDSLVEVDLEIAESDPPRHGGTFFRCVLLRCLITSCG
jgi:hypothetical protein